MNPWQVHRAVFGLPGYWELEWIKLFRTDVLEILCTPGEARRARRTYLEQNWREKQKPADA